MTVDLFKFVDEQKECFAISIIGTVISTINTDDDYVELLKENYNVFPSEELCEQAIPLGLNERKTILFAFSKGYEVLTQNRWYKTPCKYYVYFDVKNEMYKIGTTHHFKYGNVNFTDFNNAQECADFMNGGRV